MNMRAKDTAPVMGTVREGAMPNPGPKDEKHDPKSNLYLGPEEQKKKDREMVTAIFKWYEQPGGTITLACYRRYKEDPMLLPTGKEDCPLTFTDGVKYTIPYGLVRHVNEDCAYPEHCHLMDVNGNPIQSKRKGYQRMEFVPAWG